ncbi:MAG: hypothetical protein GF398_21640 [Chitinivibrionales bacterium]|nr:hypothetical protein [Chitinivibrionales bacterium]
MWIVFISIAIFGILVLAVHLNIELNSLDKSITGMTDAIRKHYESSAGSELDTAEREEA